MIQGSVAIKVRKILVENGVDRDLADALALAFDEMYHAQMSEVATKEDIKALREDMKMFMQMMDKRFEEQLHYMDERFEKLLHYVDKRFDAVDKRFEDMNKRFEDINKRFEDMNKRFEDLNKRITFLQWFIFLLFTVYTGIMAFFIRYLVLSIT